MAVPPPIAQTRRDHRQRDLAQDAPGAWGRGLRRGRKIFETIHGRHVLRNGFMDRLATLTPPGPLVKG